MVYDKKEKRRSKRFEVSGVSGKIMFTADITIINISMMGASIETSQEIKLHSEYSFKVKFNGDDLNLKGIVVWSAFDQSQTLDDGEVKTVYKAGIRFTNITGEESEKLGRFIEDNKFRLLEKRILAVRFKVKQPDDAVISVPYEYNIKKISRTGMLIETNNLFDVNSCHDMEIDLEKYAMNVKGRVVNCVKTGMDDAAKYDVGIAFVKISRENKNILIKYFEKIGIKD